MYVTLLSARLSLTHNTDGRYILSASVSLLGPWSMISIPASDTKTRPNRSPLPSLVRSPHRRQSHPAPSRAVPGALRSIFSRPRSDAKSEALEGGSLSTGRVLLQVVDP
jgi:hypothetical protein